MSKDGYGLRNFDCRRFIKPGYKVRFSEGAKEDDRRGVLPVKAVYEQFVVLQGEHTDVTVNRWNVQAVNGYKIEGGCFGKWMEEIA